MWFAEICLKIWFVLCFTLCQFAFVYFSPSSIANTSLVQRANLIAFGTFVRFALVWFCPFSLPLGVWEELRFVIMALPGLFSYFFLKYLFRFPVFLRFKTLF